MQTTTTSPQFSLDTKDLLRGLIIAIISPVLTIIIQSLDAGSLTFDWKAIGITAASAGLAYLAKNFLASSRITITDPSPSTVKAVKSGNAEVKVLTK